MFMPSNQRNEEGKQQTKEKKKNSSEDKEQSEEEKKKKLIKTSSSNTKSVSTQTLGTLTKANNSGESNQSGEDHYWSDGARRDDNEIVESHLRMDSVTRSLKKRSGDYSTTAGIDCTDVGMLKIELKEMDKSIANEEKTVSRSTELIATLEETVKEAKASLAKLRLLRKLHEEKIRTLRRTRKVKNKRKKKSSVKSSTKRRRKR
eukprot:g3708.t1